MENTENMSHESNLRPVQWRNELLLDEERNSAELKTIKNLY